MSTASSTLKGYLGIDNGTQGLSVVFTDEQLDVIATGDGRYDLVANLPDGCFEQRCQDWDAALTAAMADLFQKLHPKQPQIVAIGISGQMHGECLVDDNGQPLKNVRLWCDARNQEEGRLLTEQFQTKVAKRATAARFLWTARNLPDIAARTKHVTTPAGWAAYRLTDQFCLGIGDAAGMFPIDMNTMDYDKEKLRQFDQIVDNLQIPPLASILPKVRRAGQDAGSLTKSGSMLLGLDESHVGIPIAAGEGDQVTALAGSLIGQAGMVSCCFGTSVCANAVGDRAFVGVSPAVDQFCAADGKPINMVWLRNGTTFLNTIVESYGTFDEIMPQVVAAPPDCGGLLALPFMNDEPGLNVHEGGSAMIVGWTEHNAKPGNVAKAALLSTMFNLKLGCKVLDEQGYPRTELLMTGGLSKTQDCAQILADVFNAPVTLLAAADEGSSWGAAVLAKFRHVRHSGSSMEWTDFLETVRTTTTTSNNYHYEPIPSNVPIYETMFQRYQRLMALEPEISAAAKS